MAMLRVLLAVVMLLAVHSAARAAVSRRIWNASGPSTIAVRLNGVTISHLAFLFGSLWPSGRSS